MKHDVVILIGSKTDEAAITGSGMLDVLGWFGVTWILKVLSAHRHPDEIGEYCGQKANEGTHVFIGAASMAAHLPGAMTASLKATKQVIGVALTSEEDPTGDHALSCMTRLPTGTPVSVAGIGKHGLVNAALIAVQACLSDQTGFWGIMDQYRQEVVRKLPETLFDSQTYNYEKKKKKE